MKRLLVFLLFCANFAFAQGDGEARFEARYGMGNLKLRNFSVFGATTTKVDQFNIYGINAIFAIDKSWGFEIGVNYIPIKYTVTQGAGTTQQPSHEEINIVSLPIKARFNLVDYIFINAGMLIDFDMKNTGAEVKQSGFGLNAGLGAKYDFSNGIGVFVNPEVNLRGLSRTKKATRVATLTDLTVSFGLAYTF